VVVGVDLRAVRERSIEHRPELIDENAAV